MSLNEEKNSILSLYSIKNLKENDGKCANCGSKKYFVQASFFIDYKDPKNIDCNSLMQSAICASCQYLSSASIGAPMTILFDQSKETWLKKIWGKFISIIPYRNSDIA